MKKVFILLLVLLVGCASIPKPDFLDGTKEQVLTPSKGIKIGFQRSEPPTFIDGGRSFNIKVNLDNYFPEDVDVSLSVAQNNLDLTGFERRSEQILIPAAKYDEKGKFLGKTSESISFLDIVLDPRDLKEQTEFLAVVRYDVADFRIVMQMCVEDTLLSNKCNYEKRYSSDSYKYAPIVVEVGDVKLSGRGDGTVDILIDKINIENKGGGIISTGADEELDVHFNVVTGIPFDLECSQVSRITGKTTITDFRAPIVLENGKAVLERCEGTVVLADPNEKQDYQVEFSLSYPYRIDVRKNVEVSKLDG